MTIEIQGNKVYFVYLNYEAAELARVRLKSLNPNLCSKGGQLNALVVDLEKVQPMGEMQ